MDRAKIARDSLDIQRWANAIMETDAANIRDSRHGSVETICKLIQALAQRIEDEASQPF